MFCNFVAHYFSGFEVDYYPICLKTQQQQQQQQQDNEDFSTATYHNVSILKNFSKELINQLQLST